MGVEDLGEQWYCNFLWTCVRQKRKIPRAAQRAADSRSARDIPFFPGDASANKFAMTPIVLYGVTSRFRHCVSHVSERQHSLMRGESDSNVGRHARHMHDSCPSTHAEAFVVELQVLCCVATHLATVTGCPMQPPGPTACLLRLLSLT